jgi:hypothetical protein
VRITAAERDALYEEISARLSGIDEVWLAIEEEAWETADQLAVEFSDDLRLIHEDLGWGRGSGEDIELRTPPDVLRRVFTQMRGKAESRQATLTQERAERRGQEEVVGRLTETCQRVLRELEDEGA